MPQFMYMKSIKIKFIDHLEYCHQVGLLYSGVAMFFKLNL